MGNTLDSFKSRMTSFARPNLFEVVMFPKPDNPGGELNRRLTLGCCSATVPGINIATTEKDEGYRSIAYQKIYDDVTLQFYLHGDMKELKIMRDWMNLMIRPQDNHVGYYDTYKSIVEIKNIDRNDKKVLTTTLYDAYPKTVSALALSYDANDEVMKMDITFTYRYYKQVFGEKQETIGKGLNDITTVQRENLTAGIIDKTLTLRQRKEIFDGTVNEVEQEEY